MAQKPVMRRFAKWHIWIGWAAGLPVLMGVITGCVGGTIRDVANRPLIDYQPPSVGSSSNVSPSIGPPG